MLTYAIYDVFTATPYAGNPLAIVKGADGLSDAQMQTIASEFNLSETIFVQTPSDPANDAAVRIFTPASEIPFAGHPTIGCALHLASDQLGKGASGATIRLEEVAGLVPVQITTGPDGAQAEFVAPVLPTPTGGRFDFDQAAAALGLAPTDLGIDGHSTGVFIGGPTFAYVPLASTDALARARPMSPAWDRLIAAAGTDSVYVYAKIAGGYQARMFAPGNGIPEDPATGSASAIFAAQLLASQALADGTTQIPLLQGVEMGRPSQIGLSVDVSEGTLTQIRVSGQAVPIMTGQLNPPAQEMC